MTILTFLTGAPVTPPRDTVLTLLLDAVSAANAAGLDLAEHARAIAGGATIGGTDLRRGEVLTSLFTAALAVVEATGNPVRDRAIADELQRWLDINGRIS